MPPTRRDFLRQTLALSALGGALLREDWLECVQAAQRSAGGRTPEQLAADEDFWIGIQQAYAVDRSVINLNNGGVSPSPRVVLEALRRHYEFANQLPARHLWQVQDPQVENVRARLALAFGCETEEMAITRNASEALEICICGIDLEPGDEVIACELDYPRMLNTFRQRELRDGIVLRLVPVRCPVQDLEEVIEVYRRAITPRTRVLLVSHVVFVTGQIFPVRRLVRLGHEHGLLVIIDGAHAFAHFPFSRDELECDYYGTSLHKWLTAAHGTGFLYVRRDRIGPLWPLMAAPEPRGTNIRKFEEIGTRPAANYLTIAEALTLHNSIGPARKAARLRYLRDRWASRLTADPRIRLYTRMEPEHGCAFATFQIDGVEPARLVEHLWTKHKIFTAGIDYPPDTHAVRGVRVSPNIYTTAEEIDMFCAAVEDVLASGIPA